MKRWFKILWARIRCNWRILTRMEGCELIAIDENRIVLVALVKSDFIKFNPETGTLVFKSDSIIATYYEE